MLIRLVVLATYLLLAGFAVAEDRLKLEDYDSREGFIDFWWDESTGRLLLAVDEFDTPFLYQSSLPRGVGSNNIGLDRGQLGTTESCAS